MPTLLFVNDVSKASINAHKQRGRKHIRRDRMPIPLDESRQKVLEFRVRDIPRSTTAISNDDDDDEDLPATWTTSYDNRVNLSHSKALQRYKSHHHPPKPPIYPLSCTGTSTDPFTTSILPIDSEVHALLSFYERIVHPNTWYTESRDYALTNSLSRNAAVIVRGCFADEMSMYCMLARTASEVSVFDRFRVTRTMDFYLQKALGATRRKIAAAREAEGKANVVDTRMLLNMFYLAVAEWYRRELEASLVHLRALKVMIDCLGGLRYIDRQLREMFTLGDTYLAAERLASPLLDPGRVDPGANLEIVEWANAHRYEDRMLQMELLSGEHADVVPDDLWSLVTDLGEYTDVLILSQQYSGFPLDTPHWIHTRDLATRSRLLGLKTVDARSEALRVALIMWELMVMTVACRVRTIKLIAPKLRGILLSIDMREWKGHEAILCWILCVGSMSAAVSSTTEVWFTREIASLPIQGWTESFVVDEDALMNLARRFFYLDSVQRPIIRDLAFRVIVASGSLS